MSASVADRVAVRLAHGAGGVHDVASWQALRVPDPLIAATREELGISEWYGVATGHQPTFWHGGILAKAICAATLSRAAGCGWMHLIADHDAADPCALAYPSLREANSVRAANAHFGPAPATGTAASAIASSAVQPPDRACAAPPASADIAERLGHVAAALDAADASRGAAWRTADANFALLAGMGALDRPTHTICASTLLRTPLGRTCVERIAADPEACARAFNDALAHAPRAASRLRIDGDASDVPLWGVDGHGVRTRISGHRLRSLLRDGALDARNGIRACPAAASRAVGQADAADRPSGQCALLPRAFLATGIVRALGIHFVHGTGGEAYERAGDLWWRNALGRTLPPFSVATADLRFTPASFGLCADAAAPTPTWREAWVDPARLDGARDPVREQALLTIASLPRGSVARRQAFAAMRAHVQSLRGRRRAELDALASADAARRDVRASLDAATDRSYPAAIHDADALAALAALVEDAVSASAASSGTSGSRR